MKYILDEQGEPHLENDLMKWARWLEKFDNRLLANQTRSHSTVSTIFLGLEQGVDDGKPILWETKVFGGKCDQECERDSSKKAALKGHQRWCDKVEKE